MLKHLSRFGLAQQSNILLDNLLAMCLQRVLPICNSIAFINAQGSIESTLAKYGVVTQCKPDVVILPFKHKLHHSVNNKDTQLTSTSWDEYVKQQVAKKPQWPAAWRDVLGVIEFKQSGRVQEAPMTYNPSVYQVPTSEFLLIMPDRIDAQTIAPAPQSNQVGPSTQ
ncbi:hypothetical protein BS17DRAFT_777321, partial [Gyrodon lividus]